MNNLILPWQFILISLAGWLNRHQQAVIDYIKEDVILKERLKGKRHRPIDDQRFHPFVAARTAGAWSKSLTSRTTSPNSTSGATTSTKSGLSTIGPGAYR